MIKKKRKNQSNGSANKGSAAKTVRVIALGNRGEVEKLG